MNYVESAFIFNQISTRDNIGSSTLRWNNVSTLLINLNFHFQPNINADVFVGNNGYQILNIKVQFYLPIPCDLDFITSANMAKLMRKSITL